MPGIAIGGKTLQFTVFFAHIRLLLRQQLQKASEPRKVKPKLEKIDSLLL